MAHHVNDVTPSTENYTTPEDVTHLLCHACYPSRRGGRNGHDRRTEPVTRTR